METAEITIYKFKELSEESKETARNWWKEAFDENDSDNVTQPMKDKLEDIGLPSEDIRWRLSNCQGDGVAFYGSVDVEEYLIANKLKTKFRKLFDKDKDLLISNVEINKSSSFHMYDHHNTMSISYNEDFHGGYDNPSREQALEDFTDHLQDHIKELSKEFAKLGYEEIEYITSDEVVDESLTANDYNFTEDGKVF